MWAIPGMIHHPSAPSQHSPLPLDAILSRDASLPPSLLPQGTSSSLIPKFFPWDLAGWLGSLQALGGFGPMSHFLKSVKQSNSTSLDRSYLPSLCHFSVIWAEMSKLQNKAVQLASQDHSVLPSFETESSRSEDRQRASHWVRHAFLINHIWLPW